MPNEQACPKCGGPMDEGKVQDTMRYVSDKAQVKSWSGIPEVNVHRAQACLSCGYLELYLDPQQLAKQIAPA